MLNFANKALDITQIFTQKNSLNHKIYQKKRELEKISAQLNQLKEIYNDCNMKYENIEELSIIDTKSEPIFTQELKNIENQLIKLNEKNFPHNENELDLREKLEIINQNLNEILHRKDEKNRLIILKDNAFKNLKVKENELNICEKQLAILMLQKEQLTLNDYETKLV